MERKTYRVLSEIQVLDTMYPAGELVDLADEQATPLLAAGSVALHEGNQEPFELNNPSKAYPAAKPTE